MQMRTINIGFAPMFIVECSLSYPKIAITTEI